MNACCIGCSSPSVASPSIVSDVGAVGLDGEHRAALHRLAVDVDRARAARRRVAADVGAGQADLFADVVHEQRARLDVVRVRTPLTVTLISTVPP